MNKTIIFFGLLAIAIVFVTMPLFYTQTAKFQADLLGANLARIIPEKAGLTDKQLREEIGQMIMIGFRGTTATENSEIARIIKDVRIGGVTLFDYDTPSNSFPRNIVSPEQTKKLISDIQKYSATPLFVAVDAEGGSVNRLKQKYGFLPIISAQKMGQDKTLQTTHKESTELAGELKGLGFNMNFAPVVDLNINPKNPIIGLLGRSFSENPNEVFGNAEVFIKNHLHLFHHIKDRNRFVINLC
jgi:beta-N-acetylhexosaminidase